VSEGQSPCRRPLSCCLARGSEGLVGAEGRRSLKRLPTQPERLRGAIAPVVFADEVVDQPQVMLTALGENRLTPLRPVESLIVLPAAVSSSAIWR